MQIEGGLSGRKASVTTINQLEVFAQAVRPEWWAAVNDGRLFTIPFSAVAAGAAVVFYLQNNANVDLIVASIDLHGSVAAKLEVDEVTGTAAGGTAIVPRPRQLNDGKTLTNVVAQAAAAITGLSSTVTHGQVYVDGVINKQLEELPNSPLVIPTGQALAIDVSVAATVNGIVTVYQQFNRPETIVST